MKATKLISYGFLIFNPLIFISYFIQPVYAFTVTLTNAADTFDNVGDFFQVSGNDPASAPGQILEVLQHNGNDGVTSSSTDYVNNQENKSAGVDWTTGQLYDILISDTTIDTNQDGTADIPIYSLAFGLGINQNGTTNTNQINVENLIIELFLPNSDTSTFSLDNGTGDPTTGNTVSVINYNQGQNTAEAKFAIDLGFDYMTTYSSSSTEAFRLTSTLSNQDDGFENYFLSSGFSIEASQQIPFKFSPGLGLIISSITIGIFQWIKKRSKNKEQCL